MTAEPLAPGLQRVAVPCAVCGDPCDEVVVPTGHDSVTEDRTCARCMLAVSHGELPQDG